MDVGRAFLSFLVTSILSLAMAVPAAAQGTSGIRGNIVDKDGQPIVGATVAVTNKALNISTGAATDVKGEYRIPVPPGRGYVLRASFPTMGTLAQSDIEVPANKMLVAPITLRPRDEATGCGPMVSRAKSSVGIQGGVFDPHGQPVVGVTVSVTNPGLGIATGGQTDARGEFRIAPLSPGKGYTLSVSDPATGSATKPDIEVPADTMFLASITLRP